jgi:hypothetical protein
MKLHETRKIPKLVNPELFKEIVEKTSTEIKPKKLNLSKILFVLFVLFMIFFLYSCKYGIFQSLEEEPLPYSIK